MLALLGCGRSSHLDDDEATLVVHVDVSHQAPTPPDATLLVEAPLTDVTGRTLTFAVQARDDAAVIRRGTHRRAVITPARFAVRLQQHAAPATRSS